MQYLRFDNLLLNLSFFLGWAGSEQQFYFPFLSSQSSRATKTPKPPEHQFNIFWSEFTEINSAYYIFSLVSLEVPKRDGETADEHSKQTSVKNVEGDHKLEAEQAEQLEANDKKC